ncbi:MAG: recombination protein RecR [Synergistales bacterium]|nr:recombination protein RecR [Synergistales bacterium]
MVLPEPLEKVIAVMKKLPGIGEKSARRMAFSLLQEPTGTIEELARTLIDLKRKLHPCSKCGNITDIDPCSICTDPFRDKNILCVTETAEDLISIEQSGVFQGLYFVLNGRVSPLEGDELDPSVIHRLRKRISILEAQELIIATNPRIEGDLTFYEIMDYLDDIDIKVSRLAYGLPVGGSIEFADRTTIHAAMESRVTLAKNFNRKR